ncbi:hypothetical protein LCGC14_0251210 [marine sediment metagenome]|uniref:Uncharacterized protein n=1 Tax=marine sediment metagenome TaxID=412755 RepID=A0A0F9U8W9_9ZZZZ
MSVAEATERCHCAEQALGRVEHPERTCPVHGRVWAQNEQVLAYVQGRLGDHTSAGQCILHIGPGGEIRRLEWRAVEKVEDLLE